MEVARNINKPPARQILFVPHPDRLQNSRYFTHNQVILSRNQEKLGEHYLLRYSLREVNKLQNSMTQQGDTDCKVPGTDFRVGRYTLNITKQEQVIIYLRKANERDKPRV